MAASRLRAFRATFLFAALTAILIVGFGAVRGREAPNESIILEDGSVNPNADLSDPAVAFGLAITRQRSDWLNEFVAEGRDPRELPLAIIEVDSWGPPMTLPRAQREAQFVIQGRVLSTSYFSDARALGNPYSIATVEVDRVVKGKIRASTIEVLQGGGPVSNPQGGSLSQFPGDPLLLPGDNVILLLIPAWSDRERALGRYQTVYEAGIYLVTDAGVFANTTALAGVVSGRSPDEVLALFE